MLEQFAFISAEIILVCIILVSQLSAVFFQKSSQTIIDCTIILIFALIFIITYIPSKEVLSFNDSFLTNHFTKAAKFLVLAFSIINLMMYRDFCLISAKDIKIEIVSLMLFSTLGLFVAISSTNFMLLFCGLELQALCGYTLTASSRSSYKSSEAALKYFILGAFMTCITLLGISFIYGFSGSLQYNTSLNILQNPQVTNIGLVVGVILFIAGILFKLSAAPLHMWTPDVYEGAPVIVVNYFATAQKLGILAVLVNVYTLILGDYKQIASDLMKIVALLSMIIGAFGAINQRSLKRLMAYSTILNVGYTLIGLSLTNTAGIYSAVLYMIIYAIGVAGFFACLIALLGNRAEDATFQDIKGAVTNRKTITAAISIIMFSMIGIPPLAGFFAKYNIFYQAIIMQEYSLAITAILTSVIAAYYYLKIIRSMYFLESDQQVERIATNKGLFVVASISIYLILFLPYLM